MAPRWLPPLALALALGACAGLTLGKEFPSPTRETITNGVTAKADLVRLFGEPTQVGLDDGDPTWTWLFVRRTADQELTKQLTVRFDPRGVVKSYSFTSNFPEDMARLR